MEHCRIRTAIINKAEIYMDEFAISTFDGENVSARSIDELNVQVIMEKFGGGGHLTMAAAQLKDVSLSDAAEMLKHTLRKMHEDGDI